MAGSNTKDQKNTKVISSTSWNYVAFDKNGCVTYIKLVEYDDGMQKEFRATIKNKCRDKEKKWFNFRKL